MLGAERLNFIREYVIKNRYGSINELAELLETSPATVRRCLKQLEEEKLVESVRGGVVLSSDTRVVEKPYMEKRLKNAEEKRRIANEAVKYVQPDDSIFLDSSTTVYEMCVGLKDISGLNISTNDTYIASQLGNYDNKNILVTGGKLRNNYFTLTGFIASEVIRRISVDTFFTAVDAVSADGEFMITNTEEVDIKRSLMEKSRKTVVLCDHSKFNCSSFLTLWDHTQIDLVITGKELDDELFERYSDMGMPVIRV